MIVSAHKGKNKGKYIKSEHLIVDMSWKYRAYRGGIDKLVYKADNYLSALIRLL